MVKLFFSMLFGVDMRNSLLAYLAISLAFYFFGFPMLPWPWALLGIAAVAFYGHLPDFDLIPYRMVVKNKLNLLKLFIASAFLIVMVVGLWLKLIAFGLLAVVLWFLFWIVPLNAKKVQDRASHWPIWHYPLPVLLFSVFFTGYFALQFGMEYFWYAEMLTIVPLVLHFGHDCLGEQGFPLFSFRQSMAEHWRLHLSPFKFERVPVQVVRRFYAKQAANLHRQTGVEDLQRRADSISRSSIVSFVCLFALACGEAYLLA